MTLTKEEYEANGAIIALFAERWPKCFSVWERRRRPLKIGIHLEIIAALDGIVTPAQVSAALRAYIGNRVYRCRSYAGATRIDLAGNDAGVVTLEQAKKIKVKPKKPETIAVEPVSPKRITLDDLREAARRRREHAEAVS
jgi:ProP effector